MGVMTERASSSVLKKLTDDGSRWIVETIPTPIVKKLQLRFDSAMPGGDSEMSRRPRHNPDSADQTKRVLRFKSPYTLPSDTSVFSNHLYNKIF